MLSVDFGRKFSDHLDTVAPTKKTVVVNKVRASKYMDELHLLRTQLCRLERVWLYEPLMINKQIGHAARTAYHKERKMGKPNSTVHASSPLTPEH
ncbi:hypothetical protein HOLleu_44413 [Holothuria leucospilota]|uniref:Uncharacterized protein n=1 Tax=Holothuria leucospilota TaxID=206669 RepID=A0A9Q0YAH8_HOLLE|nr:hypothetical protein HOLleu_44413 [Holothuria leucospilota]